MIDMPAATAAPYIRKVLNFSKFKEIFTNV